MKENWYVLDLGGVLLDIDYNKTIESFVELGWQGGESFFNQMYQDEVFDLYETGHLSTMAFINKILEALPRGTSPNKAVFAWNAMLGEFPLEKIELLEKHASEKKLALLSNTNPLHLEVVRMQWQKCRSYAFEDLFQHVFYSHEIGMRKPEIETFLWVSDQLKCKPENIFFIDDSIQHIEGARNSGLNAVMYHELNDLKTYFS